MRALVDRYLQFFRHRGVMRFTLFAFVARMPIGTVGLATLLHLRDLTGSIAFAGAAMGAQFVALAATAPLQGRLIDTIGPRPVLAITGIVSPLALLVVLFARELGVPNAGLVAAAVVVGAFATPTVVVVRTALRHRFADDDARRLAYALDGTLLEIAYTVGPALIAAIVAAATPQWALAFAWLFAAGAVPMLLASGALRWWRTEVRTGRRLLGPLHDRGLIAVYLATLFLAMAFGGVEVGYPSFATAHGSTPWGPALIAINSIGSAIGGIVYGGIRLATPIERLLPRLFAFFAAPLAVHVTLSSLGAMAPWAFVAGIAIAPAMTSVAMIVSIRAPAIYATEAFTWSTTAILTGIGAGMAISGWLAEHAGPTFPFAFGALAAFVGAALALRVARTT